MKIRNRKLLLMSVSVLLIAAGYYLLAQGSITMAPILLALGYLILLPFAIII